MNPILEALFANMAVSSVLGLLALIAWRCTKSAPIAHGLLVLALAKLVTPALFSIPVPVGLEAREPTAITPTIVPAEPSTTPLDETYLSADALPVLRLPTIVEVEPAETTTLASTSEPAAVVAPPPSRLDTVLPWVWPVLATLWLLGSLYVLFALLRSKRRCVALLDRAEPAPVGVEAMVQQLANRLGLKRRPRVRIIDAAMSPFVLRHGRMATIALPRSVMLYLDGPELRAVLSHELAHLAGGDHLTRWLETAVTVVHWWNPLAWWLRRALRQAEEIRCDARAVSVLSTSARHYGRTILKTTHLEGTTTPLPLAASGLGGTKTLKKRLTMIANDKLNHRQPLWAKCALGIAAVTLLPLGLAAQDPAKSSRDKEIAALKKRLAQLLKEQKADTGASKKKSSVVIRGDKDGARSKLIRDAVRKAIAEAKAGKGDGDVNVEVFVDTDGDGMPDGKKKVRRMVKRSSSKDSDSSSSSSSKSSSSKDSDSDFDFDFDFVIDGSSDEAQAKIRQMLKEKLKGKLKGKDFDVFVDDGSKKGRLIKRRPAARKGDGDGFDVDVLIKGDDDVKKVRRLIKRKGGDGSFVFDVDVDTDSDVKVDKKTVVKIVENGVTKVLEGKDAEAWMKKMHGGKDGVFGSIVIDDLDSVGVFNVNGDSLRKKLKGAKVKLDRLPAALKDVESKFKVLRTKGHGGKPKVLDLSAIDGSDGGAMIIELDDVMAQLKDGKGLIGSLIHDEDLSRDLEAAIQDIRVIKNDGTIGALIRDDFGRELADVMLEVKPALRELDGKMIVELDTVLEGKNTKGLKHLIQTLPGKAEVFEVKDAKNFQPLLKGRSNKGNNRMLVRKASKGTEADLEAIEKKIAELEKRLEKLRRKDS